MYMKCASWLALAASSLTGAQPVMAYRILPPIQETRTADGDFRLDLKPLIGADGSITGIHVIETIQPGSHSGPLDIRAAMTAVMTRGIADRVHGMTAQDERGELKLATKDDSDTAQDVLYRHWSRTGPCTFPFGSNTRVTSNRSRKIQDRPSG